MGLLVRCVLLLAVGCADAVTFEVIVAVPKSVDRVEVDGVVTPTELEGSVRVIHVERLYPGPRATEPIRFELFSGDQVVMRGESRLGLCARCMHADCPAPDELELERVSISTFRDFRYGSFDVLTCAGGGKRDVQFW